MLYKKSNMQQMKEVSDMLSVLPAGDHKGITVHND